MMMWDTETGQELLRLPFGGAPEDRIKAVLVSPDGSRVAARDDRKAFVWEAKR